MPKKHYFYFQQFGIEKLKYMEKDGFGEGGGGGSQYLENDLKFRLLPD